MIAPIDTASAESLKRYKSKSDLKTPRSKSWADECDEEEATSEADEVGSLVDFIENDEEMSDEEEKEEAEQADDDEVQITNIIYCGKRIRRKPQRFEDEVFGSEEYRKMMLCDIPPDEMHAALVDDNFSDDEDVEEEDEDDDYEKGEEESEEEDEEEDEEEETDAKAKKRKVDA